MLLLTKIKTFYFILPEWFCLWQIKYAILTGYASMSFAHLLYGLFTSYACFIHFMINVYWLCQYYFLVIVSNYISYADIIVYIVFINNFNIVISFADYLLFILIINYFIFILVLILFYILYVLLALLVNYFIFYIIIFYYFLFYILLLFIILYCINWIINISFADYLFIHIILSLCLNINYYVISYADIIVYILCIILYLLLLFIVYIIFMFILFIIGFYFNIILLLFIISFGLLVSYYCCIIFDFILLFYIIYYIFYHLYFIIILILLLFYIIINNYNFILFISIGFANIILCLYGLLVYFISCNHKYVGLCYLLSSIVYGMSGTLCSLIIRIELWSDGNRIINPENQNMYNVYITLHGILMIFFLVMPALFGGYGNYLFPLILPAPEVGFPRINLYSFILFSISFIIIILCLFSEFGVSTGWTIYPPLSTSLMNLCPLGLDLILYGLIFSGFSSLFSSLNYICSYIFVISLYLFPLSYWSIIFTSLMLIFSLPVLSSALIIIILDLHFNGCFFDPCFSGDPVFYSHLFWFFGHPEVYILILPSFGFISQIIICIKLIFGFQSMVLAIGCISFIGIIVWGHHMYTLGLEIDNKSYFISLTIIISLPTGTKVFNWISTYLYFETNISLLFFIFIILFTLGGTTGVLLGNTNIDVALHDTYYVVAHFHLVLSLGTLISIISYLFSVLDLLYSYYSFIYNNYSIICFLINNINSFGISFTFIPLHYLGFNFIPRRTPDFNNYNWIVISSLGSNLTFFGIVCFNK